MLLQWLGTSEGSRTWSLRPHADIIIGRGDACDIVLDNQLVSRRHAQVFWQDGDYFIRDLDSKNGTRVNGQTISHEIRLRDGDEVQVALRFKLAFAGEDATTDLTWDSRVRGIAIDPETRTVIIDGIPIEPALSLRQFRLLHVLWKAGGGVVTRHDIKLAVWPEADPAGISRQAIDALVRRLRETLCAHDAQSDRILTVRGHGYRLDRG